MTTETQEMPVPPAASDTAWLAEVPSRRLVEERLEARFTLALGDRPLVVVGSTVAAGDPLLEHVRDRRVDEVAVGAGDLGAGGVDASEGPGGGPDGGTGWSADGSEDVRKAEPVAGDRWAPRSSTGRRRRDTGHEGELLAAMPAQPGHWRIVTGEHRETMVSPIDGDVIGVLPGSEVRVRTSGRALRGAFAAGSSARGRLELATDPFGELRAGGIDVGRAGSILVVGARIDAEALTRARAMGVRGIIVASLPSKDLRDFRASERRQRASLHAAPPFAVLVLEGTVRRRVPTPVAALLERLEGRDVAVVTDPPALVFEAADDELPGIDEDWVRVRSGPSAGAEGRVVGLAGLRRFARGVQLEAALVVLGGDAPIPVPIGDLERLT